MAAEDFNESKYTESAWACIASLTKVADYYSSSTVDSPMLMDILLNPSKHNAGDDAESAKRAVEKALMKSDIDVKVMRQELETYMSKQPKLTGSSSDQQKVMGRNMVRVLEAARDTKQLLGVSYSGMCAASCCFLYCVLCTTHVCEYVISFKRLIFFENSLFSRTRLYHPNHFSWDLPKKTPLQKIH
jgi:hypothetical protein